MSHQMISYNRRKALGLCVDCGKKLDRKGVRCKKCSGKKTKYERESREAYRANNVCPVCRKNTILGDEKTCPECKAAASEYMSKKRAKTEKKKYNNYMRQYQKDTYEKRKKEGICTRCGKRKADLGFYTCAVCRKKIREAKGSGEKEEKREERVNNGYCYFCEEKALDGFKVCAKHYAHLVYISSLPQTKEARARIVRSGVLY